MNSFKTFLEEGRDAPLYHATTSGALYDILEKGFIPKTFHYSEKLLLTPAPKNIKDRKITFGLSLTRSLKFAKNWNPIVFELNQRKLAQRYKIIPINYWSNNIHRKHDASEDEEFLLLKKTTSLYKYITKICISKLLGSNYIYDELRIIREKGIEVVWF